ncbi:MAG: flagellar biosynthesis protein FlhF [Patiriisocius sp.]|jgi:flagellar biosynthesis protein FlhF
MKIRRFFGKDMREALKQVKDELGGDAVIMSNKKVANGVELVAAIDPVSAPMATNNLSNTATNRPSGGTRGHHVEASRQHVAQKPSASSLREIIGDSGPDSLQALLEQQESAQAVQRSIYSASQPSAQQPLHTNQAGAQTRAQSMQPLHYSQQPEYGNTPEPRADERIFRSPAFVEPGSQQSPNVPQSTQAAGIVGVKAALTPPPSVLEPAQLDSIKAELESIKNVLKFQVSGLADERKKRNNPVHHYLHEQLTKMGVSQDLARQFVEFLPYQIDEKQGWKYILNLLSNRLHVGGNDILNQSGVVALVGPTGTGKTTTVAKLAAKFAQKYGPEQVALVTIDTYRIAAFEQLATYGKIIGCAVKKAHNSQELNDILYQMRNKKLVLIDTAGFSQRDARLIDQLTQYEQSLNVEIRKFLVLPAGSQYQVLNQTVKAYRSTDISGCIFTKLDECYSMGEALSVIIENDLSLSYVTDGQRVPEDIKLADSANLTLIAAKLFKRYGNGDATAVGTNTGAI